MRHLKVFIFGSGCFLISQIFIRIPLINVLMTLDSFKVFSSFHQLLFLFSLAITAGLFEETGRYLFRGILLVKDAGYSDAIVFGLGHSAMEIVYLFGRFFLDGSHWLIQPIAYYERLLATIAHVGMSMLIWNGYKLGKPFKYYCIAVSVHTVFDFIPKRDVLQVYTLLTLYSVLFAVYIYNSRKIYRRNENEN